MIERVSVSVQITMYFVRTYQTRQNGLGMIDVISNHELVVN